MIGRQNGKTLLYLDLIEMKLNQLEVINMAHKPAKNHPWRRTSSNEVYNWAKTESNVSKVHEFSIGTLTPRQKVLNKKYPQM